MPGVLQRLLRRRPGRGDGEPADRSEQATRSMSSVEGDGSHVPLSWFGDAPAEDDERVAARAEDDDAPAGPAAWRVRSQLRRRLRFVRRARELALRDLGGLVLELRRFDRDRPDLVAAKVETLLALDRERRGLEEALVGGEEVDVLRVAGVASCPRCGALHPSDAHFCASCGVLLKSAAGLPAGALATSHAASQESPTAVAPPPAAPAPGAVPSPSERPPA